MQPASAVETESASAVAIPETVRAVWAARLAIAAAVAFPLLLGSLHLLRPDLDPSWRVISEYSLGASGWVMRLAFVVLALGCVALFVALRAQVPSLGGRVGLGLLLVTAAGLLLAALFDTDPITADAAARTTHGRLHELGATLDLVGFAAAFLGWSLGRRNPAWRPARGLLLWTTLLVWVAEISFIVVLAVLMPANGGKLGPEVPVGWLGRFTLVTHCIWMAAVARYRLRLDAGASRALGAG